MAPCTRRTNRLSAGESENARMDNPPSTWASYHDNPGGMMSIVEMEYRELMEEKTEGSTSGIKKELTDLAAACIHALKKM